MLPIEEFNAALSLYNKRLFVSILSVFGLVLIGGVVVRIFSDGIREVYLKQFGDVAGEFLMRGSAIPVVLGVPAFIWAIDRRSRRDFRLRCPSCGKPLVNFPSLVIATRNCGFCGKRVLAERQSFD